jgi:hypothetical protein
LKIARAHTPSGIQLHGPFDILVFLSQEATTKMFGHVPTFSRRHNPDGSFDSICKLCFATIASSNLEEELAIAEAKHECNWRAFFEKGKTQL